MTAAVKLSPDRVRELRDDWQRQYDYDTDNSEVRKDAAEHIALCNHYLSTAQGQAQEIVDVLEAARRVVAATRFNSRTVAIRDLEIALRALTASQRQECET